MRRSLISSLVVAALMVSGVAPAANASDTSSEWTEEARRAHGADLAPELEPEDLVPAVAARATSEESSPVPDGAVPEVTWPDASAATATARTAKAATRVPVRVLGRAATQKADVAGVLMSVAAPARVAAGSRSVADAGVDLTVDYDAFVGAYGGDWASRLRLVQLPACALSDPGNPACRTQTPLTTSANDLSARSVSATVAAGSVVALTAGTSGSSGNWSATSLSASSSWQVSQQTGSFSWSYPFEVPPTQGGPSPSLALSYDSGSLDGRVATTNNQSSWIGDGWSMDAGFVERTYASCADDASGSANNVGHVTGDLCWKSDNATLALAGHSAELVKDATTGTWRLKEDDGTKVEHLTGAPNGDNDGEFWKVTTTDGVQYWFGRGQRPTDTVALNSAWTVPVFGNNPGDPCYQSVFASSACTQAWRWNLDYVVDPSGNSMSYVYATETNNYGRNNNTAVSSYVRGGYLTRIDYGQRQGSETSSSAPQRVTFTVAERCIPSGSVTCDPAQLSSATAGSWPDVPFDLICTSTTSCPSVTGPAFFTRKRLTTVATAVFTGGAYKPVDSWTLTQRFPSQDGADAVMWLDSIQRTGTSPGASASLPAVTFTGTQLANRVDTIGDLGPAMYRWRITSVTDEMGATTSVAYTPADCTSSDLPASPDSNTRRCFPVVWDPEGSVGPVTEYFHKYLVSGITADSKDAQSLSVETRYAYNGGAAWAYDDSELTPAAQRTWGQFRGYAQVDVVTGATYATQSHVAYRYFRGMNGDHLANGSTRSVLVDGIPDAERANGFLREQTVYDGATVVSRAVAEPWISGATATSNTGVSALLMGTGISETHTSAPALPGGERVTRTTTSYDTTYGLPTQVDDAGDVSTSSDDRCTRLTYARNSGANIVETVARTETVAVGCAANPTRPGDVISDSRVFYDGAGYGSAPTRGLATATQVLDRYEAGSPVYVTTSTAGYDANGRPVSATDALGATTTTGYTPAAGGPVTAVTTTSPDPDGAGPLTAQVSVSNLDPTRGVTTSAVDANGKTTTGVYDGLGRLTSVWLPGRALTASASTTYAYQVAVNGYSTVTTKKLSQDGSYLTSVAIYDGLGRTRQTQTQGANRDLATVLVADTTYDSRGLATVVTDAWATAGSPSTAVLLPQIAVPSRTRYTFDGAGRQTVATYDVDQQPKWSTTTSYGGDRVTTVPPPGASPTTTVADARGNTTSLIRYTTPSLTGPSQTATYGYDKAGRLTQVKDTVGNTWAYQYDLRGRRTQTSDPDKGVSTSTYDDADRLVTSTDARSVTLWYGYDTLGRRIAERQGSATGTLLASWSYDTLAKGQLTSSTRYESGNAYTTAVAGYDNAYQPTGTSLTLPASEGKLAGTYSVGYTYTLDEQVKTAVYGAVGNLPAETVTTYYDQLSLPRWSGGGLGKGTYVADSTRSSFGDLLALDLGNTASDWLTWSYEQGTRRLLTQRLERESGTGADLALTYAHDAAGNVTSITDTPTQPGVAGDTQCFAYDGLRRLTTAWTPATGGCAQTPTVAALGGAAPYWTDYTYDASGNRTTTTSHTTAGETVATYTYPATGTAQPHAVTTVAATTPTGVSTSTFAYDAAGNTTSRQIAGNATQTLAWNAEGKLASVSAGGSTVESNVYSADGSRILRRAGTKTTAYLPGGQELTLDSATSTVTGLRYYAFAGQTIAVRNGAGLAAVTSLISDNQGTALASIANSTDTLTRRYADPFGAPRDTAATPWVGDHGFLNKATDAAIGLTQVGARYLDTALGRFISVDPVMDLADPQQWNAYAYSNHNPVTWSDPTGMLYSPRGDWARGPSRSASKPVSVMSWLNSYRKGAWGAGAGALRGVWNYSSPGMISSLISSPSKFWQEHGGAQVEWVRQQTSWSGAWASASSQWNSLWAAVRKPWASGDTLGQAEQIGAGVTTVALAAIPVGEAASAARLASGARAGEGITAANMVPEAVGLEARANAVHSVLDPIAQRSRTTAALGTREGPTILAGGGRDLSPVQRGLAQSGEILARSPGAHAEATALSSAEQLGLTPQSIGVSRPICAACQLLLEDSGATITSPTTARW